MRLLTALFLTTACLLPFATGLRAAEQQPPSTGKPEQQSTDAQQIRQLIPAASGMDPRVMQHLATAAAPNADAIEQKSLTLMMLTLAPKADNEKAKEGFEFLGDEGMANPADLARELSRGSLRIGGTTLVQGPVTFIHADRITKFTCDIEGETAKGTVSFEVPKLYRGKVDYVAHRKNDAWRIDEFIVPAYGIHIVRDAKGKWTTKGE